MTDVDTREWNGATVWSEVMDDGAPSMEGSTPKRVSDFSFSLLAAQPRFLFVNSHPQDGNLCE